MHFTDFCPKKDVQNLDSKMDRETKSIKEEGPIDIVRVCSWL